MATQERKYELGVLVAIGMKKPKIMRMIAIENFFISIIGAIVGICMVAPLAYYFHYNPIKLQGEVAQIYEAYGFEPVIPFSVDPQIAFEHASVIVVISMVLVIYPILIVRKLKAVEAMKL